MLGKIVAGIPSNRPELCKKAVKAWRETGEFDEIWVMWDYFEGGQPPSVGANEHFNHGKMSDISCIPIKTGNCRSRLAYEAWKQKDVEWLVFLDDDVVPYKGNWREEINRKLKVDFRWQKPFFEIAPFTRGYPYSIREGIKQAKIVHGVWSGMPDVDAITQLILENRNDWGFFNKPMVMAYGHYFPMSAMAVAIHRDLFPACYFMWMGWDLPLNKYGDIWCGIILKKICDHFGWLVTSGAPVVYHKRASNVWANLRAEATTVEYNEEFWKWVDKENLVGEETVIECYRYIAEQMYLPDESKFKEFRKKMIEWISLFNE